jgi:hypothetical protein
MINQIAGSNGMVGSTGVHPFTVQKVLLVCGIASSLLYVATTVLGAMQWAGYDPTSQTVSELFATGALSRALVAWLLVAYDVLVYAFGVGIWMSAGAKRALHVAAVLIIAKEALGLMATLYAPMHMRGVEGNLSDTLHGVLTMLGVFLCMFPAMLFGATAFGKQFRLYAIVTIVTFLICGVWAFMEVPQIAANLPTPWAGLRERINIFAYMLWIAVLAITLLRVPSLKLINEKGAA